MRLICGFRFLLFIYLQIVFREFVWTSPVVHYRTFVLEYEVRMYGHFKKNLQTNSWSSIHKLAMWKLYDSRIMSSAIRSRGSQEKRGEAGVARYGRHKKLLVQQDSLHVQLKRTGLLNNSKVISYIFVGLFGRSIAPSIGHHDLQMTGSKFKPSTITITTTNTPKKSFHTKPALITICLVEFKQTAIWKLTKD